MRVLITGAGGFLAGHVAAMFSSRNWKVFGIGRSDPDRLAALYDPFIYQDLSSVEAVAAVMERWVPDVVIHLAAPGSVTASVRSPLSDLTAHLLPTAHLMEGIRVSSHRPKVLLVSSAAVYGSPGRLPVHESDPTVPISPYGFHKLQQELVCSEYFSLYGIGLVKARLFSTFGPRLRRLAVWDITRRALHGDDRLEGEGDETRDYLFAPDVALALVTIAEHSCFQGEVINVAAGVETSIRDLATSIYAIIGKPAFPRFDGSRSTGSPKNWRADVTELTGLGFRRRYSLNEGLATTVEWIRDVS